MCQSNLIPLVSPITVVIHETFMDALIMNPLKVFCTIMSSISRCICTHIIRTPLQKKNTTHGRIINKCQNSEYTRCRH